MRIKKGREYSFEILKAQNFSGCGRIDISLKQFQLTCSLVFGDFSMQYGAQVGTIVMKCFQLVSCTKITNVKRCMAV